MIKQKKKKKRKISVTVRNEMPSSPALTGCFICIAAKVFASDVRVNQTFTQGMLDKTSEEFKKTSGDIVAEVCLIILVGNIFCLKCISSYKMLLRIFQSP